MSETSGTYKADHAVYAQQRLVEIGMADNWEVKVADEFTLQLDYDDTPVVCQLEPPAQFYKVYGMLQDRFVGKSKQLSYSVHWSKGGNIHVLVHLPEGMAIYERIAWQGAFGSDGKREAGHLLSLHRYESNPILLFMRKRLAAVDGTLGQETART